jgi:hypothetical protein
LERLLRFEVLVAAAAAERMYCVMLYLKYACAAVATVLWSLGLVNQLPDLVQTGKYLGISALMIVLAVL